VKAINTEHSFIRLSIYKEITKNDCDQLITATKKFIELISEK
jgi:cysteine sulfinate desulfinase/cysteine desulfurase-like protein